jgi:hypothetical protein
VSFSHDVIGLPAPTTPASFIMHLTEKNYIRWGPVELRRRAHALKIDLAHVRVVICFSQALVHTTPTRGSLTIQEQRNDQTELLCTFQVGAASLKCGRNHSHHGVLVYLTSTVFVSASRAHYKTMNQAPVQHTRGLAWRHVAWCTASAIDRVSILHPTMPTPRSFINQLKMSISSPAV